MNIKTIQYHKVFNLGNYQNEKIGIEIALSDGDDPIIAHKAAVEYVEKAHLFMTQGVTYKRAKEIVNSPDMYTGNQVKQAQDIIADFEKNFKEYIAAYGGVPVLSESAEG
jgi:hypothetical protein